MLTFIVTATRQETHSDCIFSAYTTESPTVYDRKGKKKEYCL